MAAILFSFILPLVFFGLVCPACVPDNPKFYWQPCDGKNSDSSIKLKQFNITQNGKDIDVNGGFDLSTDMVMAAVFENNHGPIQKPLYDVAVRVYTKILFGSCKWIDLPTFGFSKNFDPCKISTHCRLDQGETALTVTVSPKVIPAPILGLVSVGTYYSASVTYKDNQTPLACVYAQDKVVKK